MNFVIVLFTAQKISMARSLIIYPLTIMLLVTLCSAKDNSSSKSRDKVNL